MIILVSAEAGLERCFICVLCIYAGQSPFRWERCGLNQIYCGFA